MAAEMIRKGLSKREEIEYLLVKLAQAVSQGKMKKVIDFLDGLHQRGCHEGAAIDAAKKLIRGGEKR